VEHAQVIRQVRGYGAEEWEIFTRECQQGLAKLHGYLEVKRLGGAGDHGRDVIGLCSPAACEGVWDNYQCKNYEGMLQTPQACQDAGKIIFHAFRGVFKPPRRCTFAAPKGPSTELRDMLLNPSKFRAEVIKTWDVRVAGHVVRRQRHLLEGNLADYVNEYDFESFGYITLDEMLDAHRLTAYWTERFGGLLPPPMPGVTPETVMEHETVYVGKLLDVYAEATGAAIASVGDLDAHAGWKADLQTQRVRFFDAEAFRTTYRDQTEPGTTESFAEEIYDAIEPSLVRPGTGLDRLTTALTVAGQTNPANVLTPQAKVGAKQGVCHQLANDDRVTWKV
jgi:C-terminal domain 6 of the ABC-three component (ABC-3C) systems